jgi:hypothetical protein
VLPVAGTGGGVGQHKRSQRTIGEAQVDRNRVLNRKAARRARCERLHAGDLAAQHAQVVHLVNHVDEDRTAAGFAPPRACIEIVVGLEEHRASHHGDHPAERAPVDELLRLRHDRAVRTMVADEDLRSRGVGGPDQALSFVDRRRKRLLDKRRQPRLDTLQRLRHVELVRGCEDDAVGPIAPQQVVERPITRDAGSRSGFRRGGCRIDDRR